MAIPLFNSELGEATNTAFHNPLTISAITVPSVTDGMLAVSLSYLFNSGTRTVSGVTFDGTALTNQTSANSGGSVTHRHEWWTLDDPTATTGDVVVSYTADMRATRATAYMFSGTDGVGATQESTAVTDSPTLSITTTRADSLVVAGLFIDGGDTDPFTPGSGITERKDAALAGRFGYWDGEKGVASPGATTMDVTASASDDSALTAIEIRSPVAAASGLGHGSLLGSRRNQLVI